MDKEDIANALVIDDIIDTFDEEELLEQDEEKEDVNAENSDEENTCIDESGNSEPLQDEIENEDLGAHHLDGPKSQSKYGFLWQFVRDLLHNSIYNPSIIRWENVEDGEFRIVDSNMVSSLWATVKGNKKMNYEKFSRAMRYYYKTKIFAIVENKRLVYKFGKKAKGWKPKTEANYDKKDPVWCHQNTRCVKCLRILHSESKLKDHTLNCKGLNLLKLEKKRQFKKNIHLKNCSSQPEDANLPSVSTSNQSIEEREREALESLISLGGQNEDSRPSDDSLESGACHSEGQSSVSTVSKQTVQVADKIQFLKTACEKSKTQTILQKREHFVELKEDRNVKPESEDEIEIVHEVKRVGQEQVSNIEEVVETVLNNKLDHKTSDGSNTESEIGKVVTTREVRVNSKYQNLFTLRKIENPPNSPTPIVIEAKKMLRLNQKLSNTIGGQRPQECGNINDIAVLEGSPPKLAKMAGQGRVILQNNPTIKTDSPTLANLLSKCPENLEIPQRVAGALTLKRKFPDPAPVEPLPGLWTFMRGLLHNPNFNPKLLAWEDVDKGVFRIKELKEFYSVWKELRGLPITYEMLVKTVKVYDDMEILHPIEGQRCVYKFGKNASDWKPYPGEISTGVTMNLLGGKRFFPNQETWPKSRFYNDFSRRPPALSSIPRTNTTPVPSLEGGAAPKSLTTLFTITPLDASVTNFSEMKVMSDNSRIVKPNSIPISHTSGSPSTGTRVPLAISKLETSNPCQGIPEYICLASKPEVNKDIEDSFAASADTEILEAKCKVLFPNIQNGKVILTFENGKTIELEREIFSSVEKDLRSFSSCKMETKKSNKIDLRKIRKKKKFLKKRPQKLSVKINPDLFENKFHVPKSEPSSVATFTPRKLQAILPKPAPIVNSPPVTIEKAAPEPPPALLPQEKLDNIDEDILTISDGETDYEEEFQVNDFGDNLTEEERRENVARCKEYRERKKAEVVEGENERWILEKESRKLNLRYNLLQRCRSSLESKLKEWIDKGYVNM